MVRGVFLTVRSLLLVFFLTPLAFGASITRDVDDFDEDNPRYAMIIPYVFYTDSLELAGGLAGGTAGYWQDQMSFFGAVMGSTNSSYGFYFAVTDMKMGAERLFIDTYGSVSWYTEHRKYIPGNPLFPDERAGSNDSSEDNFLTGEGWDNQLELEFDYLLPIGEGRDTVMNTYVLDSGLLVKESTNRGTWNPFRSGWTYLEVKPFFVEQSLDSESESFEDYRSSGLGLGLKYDNTDFFTNPSRGNKTMLNVMHDFGTGSNTFSWTAVEGELTQYFSLGKNRFLRQQVLALTAWTAYSPSWEQVEIDGTTRVIDRPPADYGANLGGFYRMRAYPSERFYDKAAVYYSAEYRIIPEWQPLPEIEWLDFLDIDWWQLVLFAELGRVAPEWSLDTLHEDMKFDGGVSLRMLISKAVGRLDVGFSDESSSVTVLIGHPF